MAVNAEIRLDDAARATIPAAVLTALEVGPGDGIVFEVEPSSVRVRPARPHAAADLAELAHAFADWDNPDDEAFADLSEPIAGAWGN